MTNEETLRMASEAGFSVHEGMAWGGASDLRRFVDAAVKAEREACAKVCEEFDFEFQDDSSGSIQGAADAIRARNNT